MHEVVDGEREGGEPAPPVNGAHRSSPEPEQAPCHEARIHGILEVRFASVALDHTFCAGKPKN